MSRPLFSMVAALGLFLVAVFGYLAWYSAVVDESAHAQDIANEITIRSRAEVRISAARSTLENLSVAESTVAGYFVAQADIVPFIEHLQALGASTGALVSVRSVAADTAGPTPPIHISLLITGSFDHIVRAIGAIEYAPYSLTTSALSLTQEHGAWQADLDIDVSSIALPPGPQAPQMPKAVQGATASTTTP